MTPERERAVEMKPERRIADRRLGPNWFYSERREWVRRKEQAVTEPSLEDERIEMERDFRLDSTIRLIDGIYMIPYDAHQQAMRRMEDWIRERVWASHGCIGLYGDDGELQCNNVQRHRGEALDFKRMPLEKVFEVDAQCRLEMAGEQQALEARVKELEGQAMQDQARDSQDYAEALEASSRRLKTMLQERDMGRETVEALSLSNEALESELQLKQQALREAQEALKQIAEAHGELATGRIARNALASIDRLGKSVMEESSKEPDMQPALESNRKYEEWRQLCREVIQERDQRAQALEARVKQLEEQLAHAQQR